jgi:hypothetical protein
MKLLIESRNLMAFKIGAENNFLNGSYYWSFFEYWDKAEGKFFKLNANRKIGFVATPFLVKLQKV